jgi:hypothetical protein
MRLPDFHANKSLILLKEKMGIPPNVYGTGTGYVVRETLSNDERERLASGDGVDTSWNDLDILQNGTITFKGTRVLIYIRDVHVLGGHETERRYHLATCRTIELMQRANRITRYVVAQRPDGIFKINITSQGYTRTEMRRLSVCQNCLSMLNFDGFKDLPGPSRPQFVSGFTPDRFFALYPQSPHTKVPFYGEDGAPPNDYTRDFPEISHALRQQLNWECQDCRRDFSSTVLRRFLQVHHRNAGRWDNSPENLEVLCVGCHAGRPMHSHIKRLPIYNEYKSRFP